MLRYLSFLGVIFFPYRFRTILLLIIYPRQAGTIRAVDIYQYSPAGFSHGDLIRNFPDLQAVITYNIQQIEYRRQDNKIAEDRKHMTT